MSRIFHRLYSAFIDMKIKSKLVISYIILSIFVLGSLYVITHQHITNILIEREQRLIADTVNQTAIQLDYRMQIYNALSNYLFNDTVLLNYLNDSYGNHYFRMFRAYADYIIPVFQTYRFLHPNLTSLSVYTGSDLLSFMGLVRPLTTLKEKPWFELVEDRFQPTWFISEDDSGFHLHSVRRMPRGEGVDKINYLSLQFNHASFFAPLTDISTDEHGIAIIDAKGDIIFLYSTLSSSVDPSYFRNEHPSDTSGDYLLIRTQVYDGLWTIYYYTPIAYVTESVAGVLQAVFLAFAIALLLIGLLTWTFSGIIVAPVESLAKNMQQVQQGDLTVNVTTKRNDEVGILVHNFTEMINQIQHLIQVVYKSEIEKKEYQYAILRAQINPHFLYNSLSLINSKAIVSGDEDISKMALLIASFFRTTLNNGEEMTTVRNELNNIKSYISIQLLLCNNKFQVHYRLEENMMEYVMPNFILQPLVENAIGHGLMDYENENRHLTIETNISKEFLIFRVIDNGIGMDEERVNSLLNDQADGYGLKNIKGRLRLLYENDFRFHIESALGKGTSILIKIPHHESNIA